MYKSFRVFLFIASVAVVAPHSIAGQAYPLAELEAWNKIKESSVAADYHTFLQQFPNGSLAVRAREKMNSLGDPVWNELKKSNDPFKYRDYIRANPNSPFLDQAKARLEILTPAAVEWEKVKAVGDTQSIMRFVSANPNGPYAADAKAMIEPELWTKISSVGSDEVLEFYSLHYAGTDRGKEASAKLRTRKMAQREAEFQGIRSRIAAHNGVRATRQQTGGTTGGILWHENKIPDVCTLETTQNDLSTANPLWYSSEVYRIDLRLVKNVYSHNTFPGLTLVYISSTPTKYSSYNDPKFAGSQQSYNRKSTAKPFLPYMAPQAVQQSWVIPFTTHDAKLAAKFVEDVNALAAMCRASK